MERKHASAALAHVFGWHLLQIGQWGDDDLVAEARTQHKSILARGAVEGLPATQQPVSRIQSRADVLGVASDSVDAVFLPHTLEHESDPHAILREVERILMGDGHVIVLGFRPMSIWGCRHLLARDGFPVGTERLLAERRVRDWLQLLGFEIVDARRYLFTGPWGRAAPNTERFLETVGERAWPLLAGAYLLKARKRVYAMTPLRFRWRKRPQVVGGLIEPATRASHES
ncbi:MAG: methyltransferase domain-containing protein [Candidatus Obscuribacterales bacterium]|nr:methyltransferase domain-containing protein [Steroidobacteraceae bacterium]